MKIMKMWRNTTLFAYFRFMGYVMMIVGIYLIVNGIGDYVARRKDRVIARLNISSKVRRL